MASGKKPSRSGPIPARVNESVTDGRKIIPSMPKNDNERKFKVSFS